MCKFSYDWHEEGSYRTVLFDKFDGMQIGEVSHYTGTTSFAYLYGVGLGQYKTKELARQKIEDLLDSGVATHAMAKEWVEGDARRSPDGKFVYA